MTKKELEDLGLSAEQVASVVKINSTDIAAEKVTYTVQVTNLQAEVDSLNTQVKERDTQLDTLKASNGDANAMKEQIATLQAANETAKTAHEAEMNQVKIDFAVEKALSGAKAKNVKAVKALLELGDAQLDADGNVKGLKEQIDTLTKDEGTKFLFESTTKQQFRGMQPGTSNDTVPSGGADMSKMSYEEMCAFVETQSNDGAVV